MGMRTDPAHGSEDGVWASLAEIFMAMSMGLLLIGIAAGKSTPPPAAAAPLPTTRPTAAALDPDAAAARYRALKGADLVHARHDGSKLPVTGSVVRVLADGSVLCDGRLTTLDELPARLSQTAGGGGSSCLLAPDAQATVANTTAVEVTLRRHDVAYVRVFVRFTP